MSPPTVTPLIKETFLFNKQNSNSFKGSHSHISHQGQGKTRFYRLQAGKQYRLENTGRRAVTLGMSTNNLTVG